MAKQKHDTEPHNVAEDVLKKAPPRENQKKVAPRDQQNRQNIAPGHGKRISDKG